MQNRKPGRPRSTQADRAILEAARDLLLADGYEQLTVQAIADRAGVTRPTVYRRWSTKAQVVADAVLAGYLTPGLGPAGASPPDTLGDASADLRAWLHTAATGLADPANVTIIRALAAAAAERDDDATRLYGAFTEPGRAQLVALLRAGVERGQVRAGADLEAAADAIQGAVLYTVLSQRPPRLEHLDSLADVLFTGLAERPAPTGG